MTRPFTWYHNFLPHDLDLEVWLTLKKNLTLAITLLPGEIGLSYCTCVFLVTRPFTWCHNIFDLVTLTLKFDLLLKNFNHGFYLEKVATLRASLSSDNSYCYCANKSFISMILCVVEGDIKNVLVTQLHCCRFITHSKSLFCASGVAFEERINHIDFQGQSSRSWAIVRMQGDTSFLCRLRSIAAHRDHFVWRLSVCACVCLSDSHTFLIVTRSYVSQATHAFLGMLPLCFSLSRNMQRLEWT